MAQKPLRGLFTPKTGIFDHYSETDREMIKSSNLALAGILKRILLNHYSVDKQIMVYAVNEKRFLFRLNHHFQSASVVNNDESSDKRKVDRFLRDFSEFIRDKDIYIDENQYRYPLISFRPDELISVLKEFTKDFSDNSSYERALQAVVAIRTTNSDFSQLPS